MRGMMSNDEGTRAGAGEGVPEFSQRARVLNVLWAPIDLEAFSANHPPTMPSHWCSGHKECVQLWPPHAMSCALSVSHM